MILSVANIKKTINYCKKNGVKEAFYNAYERVSYNRKNKYSYEAPSDEELEYQKNNQPEYCPLLSILVPAYETKPVYIEDLVLSVVDQTYDNYELIIADASESNDVRYMVSGLMEQYDKIKYVRLDENKGISGNSNEGLLHVTGDYVGLLDHDDILTPDALYHIAVEIGEARKRFGAPVLIYSDEDKTNSYLEYFYEPNIKCRFNKGMILTNNYVCHLSFFRKDVIKELGFRPEYDGAQDYDLVLRTVLYAEKTYGDGYENRIRHVPKVLYHWRCHEASTAENPQSKMYAYDNGRKAVESYLEAKNINGTVTHTKHLGFYRVNYTDGIFSARADVGMVGGPVISGGKIIGGAMDAKGRILYEGLNVHFSGNMHRAILQQDVGAVDIRNVLVRDDLIHLFEKSTGLSYPIDESKIKLNNESEKQEFFVKKSISFCNKLKKQGIIVTYDPMLGQDAKKAQEV